MASRPALQPGPLWWKTSPLTTAPSLLPLKCLNGYINAALLPSWLFWFLVCSSSKLRYIGCIAKLRLTCDQAVLLPFLFLAIPGNKNTWSQVKLRNAGTLSKFWHWEQFCFSPVHVGKIAKKTAWYVVPFSAMSGLVFIIVATGVVILLLRRWRSTRKGEEPMEGEEVEMNEQAITPRKTKVRWECLPILKTSKEPPTVVWNKPRHLFILGSLHGNY